MFGMRFSLLLLAALLGASACAQSLAEVKGYGAAYAKAKKALAAKPKDKALRRAFVAAGDRYATATMMAPELDRKVKYRDALRLYREVLKVDPSNHEAKSNSDLIVSIYKQFGKPVPR
jgi:tetratricopeptide (TPR) repeat protein